MNVSNQQEVTHKLQSIALKLDKGISSGEIETEFAASAQKYIDKFYVDIEKDSVSDWMHLVYEAQALLHWIDGDEKNARKVILKAVEAKGSIDLITESGRGLLGNVEGISIDARGRVGIGSPIFSRVALTFGILSLLLALSGSSLGPTLGAAAVILGGTSLKTSNRRTAIIGLALGLVGIIVGTVIRIYILK